MSPRADYFAHGCKWINFQVSDKFIRLLVYSYAKHLRVIFQATLSSGNRDPAESLTERNSCLELTPDFRLVVRVCRDAEYCQDRHCVRKCCLEDVDNGRRINCSAVGNNANKRNFYEDFSNFTETAWDATEYGVQIGLNCVDLYSEYVNNTYGVSENGSLKLSSSVWIPPKMYCMASISNSEYDGLVAFICFGENKDEDEDNVRFRKKKD
ncbi:hypothetical protein K0M31_012563 [Melipona bicolor]|uniref:Uncharacterized protein n=1 Tax=Melipona bicolor TaxID=60889 RepID=A0AA40FJE1_9HYME|nr:hypothetical protein K0M31_012563 [Melipona bicolor]